MGAGNLDGCGKCVKWSLVAINAFVMVMSQLCATNSIFNSSFLQLGGIAIIGVGSWTLADKAFMEVLLRNNLYLSAAYIMIGCGCLAIILSVLGCVGATKVQDHDLAIIEE